MNALIVVIKNSYLFQWGIYVANKENQESFLGFFELNEGVTGEAIAALIESVLAECHLDSIKMRGQAYDSASSMSGRYNGCAAIIQWKYPLDMYSHCCSNALNLAVVNTCSLVMVQKRRVINKTRNGMEWNGMEKVNKTQNGTAELAQSTPTHPWPTELHPRKLFVHAESTR